MRQLLPGLLGLALVGLVLWAAVPPGGTAPDEPAAPPPPAPGEEPVPSAFDAELERALAHARALLAEGTPEARTEALDVYDRILAECDPNQREARLALGFTDFQQDVLGRLLEPGGDPIPEVVSFRRGYPFLDEVQAFNRKRWLKGEAEVERARAAVRAMNDHAERLPTDRLYRLGDRMRANIAMDPVLGAYNYEARWAAPYLLVYASSERLSEYDLRKEPDLEKRERMRAALRARRAAWSDVLDRKASAFTQLYQEFLRRYGKRHDLRPLTAPYGGRPDLAWPYRTYADGVALVVWMFHTQRDFAAYLSLTGRGRDAMVYKGWLEPSTGWVWCRDRYAALDLVPPRPASEPSPEDELRDQLWLGTHQLLHWFAMQRNRWRRPSSDWDPLGDGLAGYLSGVKVEEHGTLVFTGVNPGLLAEARRADRERRERGKRYDVLPLALLTPPAWRGAHPPEPSEGPFFGAEPEGPPFPHDLYLQQAWMFVHFLHHHEGGKYRERFHEFLDAQLDRSLGGETWKSMLARVFRLVNDADWEELQAEFERYVFEHILPEEDG